MFKPPALSERLVQLKDYWADPQTGMNCVIRWALQPDYPPDDCRRKQTLTEHVVSITRLCMYVVVRISAYGAVDRELLYESFLFHDDGEWMLGRDIIAQLKTPEHDLQEYSAFVRCYGTLPEKVFQQMHRVFLLQFVLGGSDILPADAQIIVKELREWKMREARIFRAVELLDYMQYAFEQYTERENFTLLERVVRRNLSELDGLADAIPGFRETIWTVEDTKWCCNYLAFCDAATATGK